MDTSTQTDLQKLYREYLDNCDELGYHKEGCFYCGGDHQASLCPDSEAKVEYWTPTVREPNESLQYFQYAKRFLGGDASSQ